MEETNLLHRRTANNTPSHFPPSATPFPFERGLDFSDLLAESTTWKSKASNLTKEKPSKHYFNQVITIKELSLVRHGEKAHCPPLQFRPGTPGRHEECRRQTQFERYSTKWDQCSPKLSWASLD